MSSTKSKNGLGRGAAGIIGSVSLAFFGVTMSYVDKTIYVLDDIVVAMLGLIVLLPYLVYRNKTFLGGMKARRHLHRTAGHSIRSEVCPALCRAERTRRDGDYVSTVFFFLAVILNRVIRLCC